MTVRDFSALGRREGKQYGSSSVDQGEQLPGLPAQEQVEMWPPPRGAVGMASSGRARICLGQEGEESEEVVPAQTLQCWSPGEEWRPL